MRMQSASEAKGTKTATSHLVPTEGTKLRELYDLLQANRGLPIDAFLSMRYPRTSIYQLENFYGLDIRRICNGRWVLAGEWFGQTYVDYIADVIRKHDQQIR